MLEYIENYYPMPLYNNMKSMVCIGEMLDFDRGVVYLKIGSEVYKIDFCQSPNYHRVYSNKLNFKGNSIRYPYIINYIHNSQLVLQVKTKSAEAKHLELHHFVIVTEGKLIEVLVENKPLISIDNCEKETCWKL